MWLKLTKRYDSEPVLVNADSVWAIETVSLTSGTFTRLSFGHDDHLDVKESVETIVEFMKIGSEV